MSKPKNDETAALYIAAHKKDQTPVIIKTNRHPRKALNVRADYALPENSCTLLSLLFTAYRLNMVEVAERLGVDYKLLARYLKGYVRPDTLDPVFTAKLADFLHVHKNVVLALIDTTCFAPWLSDLTPLADGEARDPLSLVHNPGEVKSYA